MIRLRKSCPEIGLGTYKLIESSSPSILGIQYEHEGQTLVILHNFSDKPQRSEFNMNGNTLLMDLINKNDQKPKAGKHSVNLAGYGNKWFRVARD